MIAAIRTAVLVSTIAMVAAAAPETQRTFPSADAAVRALLEAVASGKIDQIVAMFGPDGADLVSSSDPATARLNGQIFTAATAERWHLVDVSATKKTLVVGNEDWPFPVPLVKSGNAWHFDIAAGKEEVLDRRIGRNELSVIATCHAYVAAQQRYARDGHDGLPPGRYAASFTSTAGRQDGLYWPAAHREHRSPLGDLVAQAAAEGRTVGDRPSLSPFYGYYFRIVTAQGTHAPGGAKSYVVDGRLSGGFALVAWPAQYDVTGVMTFIVNQDGSVRQKDLGPETSTLASAIVTYDPDPSWRIVR
jgi:hypothetical protein